MSKVLEITKKCVWGLAVRKFFIIGIISFFMPHKE